MANALTFPNVSQEVFNKLLDQLRAGNANVAVQADGSFSVEGAGITAVASHAGSVATVQVVHKPFLVTIGVVQSHIQAALDKARTA